MTTTTTTMTRMVNPAIMDNDIITVGRLVHVQARTWPGINKPGGVGKVIRVDYDNHNNDDTEKDATNAATAYATKASPAATNPTHVDIKYVVGSSREKRVPVEYVRLAPEFEEHLQTTTTTSTSTKISTSSSSSSSDRDGPRRHHSSLRDRNMLQGRCTRCGSLRIDCGSCDWATEEVGRASLNVTSKAKDNNKERDVDDEDEDDDSDDQEMKELQQLLHEARRRRQNFQRKRRRWEEAVAGTKEKTGTVPYDDCSDDESQGSVGGRRQRQRRGQKKSRRRQARKKSYVQILVGKDGGLSSFVVGAAERMVGGRRGRLRKMRPVGKSVLENLGGDDVQRDSSQSHSKDGGRSSGQVGSSRDNDSKSSNGRGDGFVVDTDDGHDWEPDESIMEYRASPSQSSPINNNQYENLAERAVERAKSGTGELAEADHDLLAMSEFIQPEGQDAIDNLPGDMVDFSKNIPYHGLADFFDDLASKIEDRLLPDSKLQVAKLRRTLRSMKNASLPTSIAPSASAVNLLESCSETWESIRVSLIQNGTDQCRVALRRLDDDKLYRKQKHLLTVSQRKKCRGSGAMDARQLRMDAMNEAVDDLWRDLKHIVDVCESECPDPNEAAADYSDEDGDSFSGDMAYDSPDTDDDAVGLFDEDGEEESGNSRQEGAPLALLHPHPHATLKRQVGGLSRDDAAHALIGKRRDDSKHAKPAEVKRRKITSRTTSNRGLQRPHIRDCGTAGDSYLVVSSTINDIASEMASASTENVSRKGQGDKRRRSRRHPTPFSSNVFLEQGIAAVHDRSPISQRMQNWFDAQELNSDMEEDNASDCTSDNNSLSRQRGRQKEASTVTSDKVPPLRRTILGQQVQRDSGPPLQENDAHEKEAQRDSREASHYPISLAGSFLQQLQNFTSAPQEDCIPTSTFVDVFESLDSFERIYPDCPSECFAVISAIGGSLSSSPDLASTFLQKAHTVLADSPMTIQEVLATHKSEASLHLRLLALCVQCLGFDLSSDIPAVFKKTNRRHFLNLLVLQLVDAMYASFLPSSWGFDMQERRYTLQLLAPLRDALARTIPLIESICQCVEQRFECQKWRLSMDEKQIFVSSVSLDEWKECLESGKETIPSAPEIRLKTLGKVWPGIEAEALWKSMLFVCLSKTHCQSISNGDARWRLILRIFFCTVLSSGSGDDIQLLVPREEQLSACESHFDWLLSMLRKGFLGPLPDNDFMLTKLTKQALKLKAGALSTENDPLDRPEVTASLVWKSSHPSYLDSLGVDDALENWKLEEGESTRGIIWRLFLPTSGMLSKCLTLIAAWSKHVPNKTVRYNRFEKALSSIQEFLSKEARSEERKRRTNVTLSFETTFGNAAEKAGCVLMREAAAKILIMRCLLDDSIARGNTSVGRNQFGTSLHSTAWDLIADENMKKRQSGFLLGREETMCYTGDPVRLVKAVEVMGSVLCIQVNITPWLPSDKRSPTRVLGTPVNCDAQSIFFTVSCMFACLDCLCDLQPGDALLPRMYEALCLAFQRMILAVKFERYHLATESLKSICMARFASVLTRCLQKHMTSVGEANERLTLRLFLAMVRSILSFLSPTSPTLGDPATISGARSTDANQTDDDDVWGSIDDDTLAAFDLDGVIRSRATALKEDSQEGRLWERLLQAFDASMPSRRFAIVQAHDTGLQMSSMGKDNFAKETRRIVECFASVIVLRNDKKTPPQINDLSASWIRRSFVENEDTESYLEASQILSRELCSLYLKFPSHSASAGNNAEAFLFAFLASLLDASRLDLLPTCNVQKFHDDVLEQATTLFDLVNDRTGQGSAEWARARQRQRRNLDEAIKIWAFGKNLRSLFSNTQAPNRTSSLEVICEKLLTPDGDSDASMESETLRSFATIRSLITTTQKTNDNRVFERLASFLLMVLSKQVLKVLEGQRYNEQAGRCRNNDKEIRFKLAKLSETLTCCVEMLIASAAWILQESPATSSEGWALVLRTLRDKLFVPALRRQKVVGTAFLLEIVLGTEAALNATSSTPSGPTNLSRTMNPVADFGANLFDNILRRGRQLMMASVKNDQHRSLQMALVEALLSSETDHEGSIAKIIGFSLPTNSQQPLPSDQHYSYDSIIQQNIDEYMAIIDNQLWVERAADKAYLETAMEGKRLFLTTYVLPRLTHTHTSLEKKRKLMRLLAYGLETGIATKDKALSKDLACLLIKAISTTTYQSLIQSDPDNDLIAASLVSARHLTKLQLTHFVDDNDPQAAISFSCEALLHSKGKTMLELSTIETTGAYIWSFFQWIYGVANMMTTNGDNSTDLTFVRRMWREAGEESRAGGIDEELLDFFTLSKPFSTWDRLLIDLEGFVFLSRTSNLGAKVVNVYQKHAEIMKAANVDIQTWSPAPAAQREAKELLAAIVLAL